MQIKMFASGSNSGIWKKLVMNVAEMTAVQLF